MQIVRILYFALGGGFLFQLGHTLHSVQKVQPFQMCWSECYCYSHLSSSELAADVPVAGAEIPSSWQELFDQLTIQRVAKHKKDIIQTHPTDTVRTTAAATVCTTGRCDDDGGWADSTCPTSSRRGRNWSALCSCPTTKDRRPAAS